MQPITDKPLSGTQINFSHPLARGIVGCWLMNEGGWRCYDTSPYKNHGTLVGFDSPPNRSSLGTAFDGTDDYVDAGTAASLNITAAITVEAWINAVNPTSGQQEIVSKSDGTVNAQYEFILRSTTGRIGFASKIGGTFYLENGNTVLTANKWYHGAVSFDGTTIRFYLNGIQDGTVSHIGTMNSQTEPVRIGKRGNGALFRGTIGLVRIWNRVLLAQEVKELYLNPYDMFLKE